MSVLLDVVEETPVPQPQPAGPTGLLAGRKLLITGVLTEASIAFSVARLAQEQGAQVVLSTAARTMGITRRIANRLPEPTEVVELDVTSSDDLDALGERLAAAGLDELDGYLHAIAFAPAAALGGGFLDATWEDVQQAFHISTYSLVSITRALLPRLRPGSSIVGLDFDATKAWPCYDWMGVAKAGLESATRYLAASVGERGIRVNLVAAGPLRTPAAKGIPGFDRFEDVWPQRAPLGWSLTDAEPVAQACVALLSPWFPATTGSVIHVDGGVHAVGA
jgi:enoyl ACP reductase